MWILKLLQNFLLYGRYHKARGSLTRKKVFMNSHCTLILLTVRPNYSQNTFTIKYGHCRFMSACAYSHDAGFSPKLAVYLQSSFFSIKRYVKLSASFHGSIFLFKSSHIICPAIYCSNIEETLYLMEIWGGNPVWKVQRFPVQITQASWELPRVILCTR